MRQKIKVYKLNLDSNFDLSLEEFNKNLSENEKVLSTSIKDNLMYITTSVDNAGRVLLESTNSNSKS